VKNKVFHHSQLVRVVETHRYPTRTNNDFVISICRTNCNDGSRRKEAGAVATPKIIKIKKIISKILPIYTFANTTVHITHKKNTKTN
jgi:hypothetical protein